MFNKMTTSNSDTTTRSLGSLKSIDTGKRSKSPSSYRKKCDLIPRAMCSFAAASTTPSIGTSYVHQNAGRRSQVEWSMARTNPTTCMVACGKISMQASVPKNQKERRVYTLKTGTLITLSMLRMIKVRYSGRIWICRKSHQSSETQHPDADYALWKEDERRNREIVELPCNDDGNENAGGTSTST